MFRNSKLYFFHFDQKSGIKNVEVEIQNLGTGVYREGYADSNKGF